MITNKWSIRAASIVAAAAIAIGVGGGTALAADDSAASLSELSTKLEAAMKNRPSKYEFTYTGPSLAKTDLTNMFTDIYSRNDYLKYSTKTYQGSSAGAFAFTYWESVTQATYVQSKVTEVLGGIITSGMNDFQKEKAIHDWIEKNLSYDTTLKQHSAYAGLVTPFKTVCQGYALLANRMLTDAGIENRIIEGKVGSQLHTWNLVKLEGKWYHLDTTWDDPVPDVSNRVVYSYYNLTDDEIGVDHTWTRANYPAANTGFGQTLTSKKTGDSVTDAVYQNIYDALGLELLDAANTVSSSSELSAKVQQAIAANKTSFKFRHTNKAAAAADLKAAMTGMKNVKSYSLSVTAYTHTADTKDGLLDVQQFNYTPPVDVQTVSVSTYSVNLKLGAAPAAATITLKANITPSDATNKSVIWTSDTPSVATVSATGIVKALKAGSAKITATTASGNLTSTADVTVIQAVSRITVSKAVYTLKVGGPDYTIVPTVLPATATDKEVKWTSSNNSSVTVDSSGAIHAVAPGVALITATAKDGNKKAYTTVRVPTNASGVTLFNTDVTLKLGTSGAALRAIVAPLKATDKVVAWSSDDTSVATVTATGVVKPIKEGTAKITATTRDGGFQATANVTVVRGVTSIVLDQTKLTVKVGGPDKLLTATLNPSDATNKNVTWSSNKPSTVTVDSYGNVHAVEAGIAIITVTSVQDKTKVARATVTVPVNVTGIALNTNKVDLKVGKTLLLRATIAPANATTRTYTWTSSNNAVASISSTGVVTALSVGTADFTVTSTDGNFTATATITVS